MSEPDLLIHEEDYVRQRWAPRPGDPSYLFLSDLRVALGRYGSQAGLRVLDYGCGGSPYRGLFPNADFRRADVGSVEGLDYPLDGSGVVPERSEFFDIILSTQVLEHLARPLLYLKEAHRLLRVDGLLICTTHGSFPDHGCPEDYRRWTPTGLVLELEEAGFAKFEILKITTGPRAVLFLMEQLSASFAASRGTVVGLGLWAARVVARVGRAHIHRNLDTHFADYRVVSEDLANHRFYVGLVCVAWKLPRP